MLKLQGNSTTTISKNDPVTQGGWTSNTPPPNGSSPIFDSPTILSSNIDTLVLTLDILWMDSKFLMYLKEMKELAIKIKNNYPVLFKGSTDSIDQKFLIKEHGSGGYEWILHNNEYRLRIGSWLTLNSKPNVTIIINSETLWRLGLYNAVDNIIDLLKSQGGSIKTVKLSRVDLCADIILPESMWSKELEDFGVTRANYSGTRSFNRKLTGIDFGQGDILARLYDKPAEIVAKKSKKNWMFDVWNLKEVPKDKKIIRVEFQVRREIIKDLGLNEVSDLFIYYSNLWAYCTKKWLTFKNNPGKHQTHQRKVLDWWIVIQNGFLGVQDPKPLIRFKASKADEKQLLSQAMGLVSSLKALHFESENIDSDHNISIEEALFDVSKMSNDLGKTQADFNQEIEKKRAKFVRSKDKLKEIHGERAKLSKN